MAASLRRHIEALNSHCASAGGAFSQLKLDEDKVSIQVQAEGCKGTVYICLYERSSYPRTGGLAFGDGSYELVAAVVSVREAIDENAALDHVLRLLSSKLKDKATAAVVASLPVTDPESSPIETLIGDEVDEVDALLPAVSMVALPNDLLQIIIQDVFKRSARLDPRDAVAFGSVSKELRTATQELQQQLQANHQVATALCVKLGHQSCKELREATWVEWFEKGPSEADLALLGKLGAELRALGHLILCESSGGPNGVLRLAEGLVAGALPALNSLNLNNLHMGVAGASALAAALDRGAMPQLRHIVLCGMVDDAELAALAPALRRRLELETLNFKGNLFGVEGLTALVAPPPPAGAPPLPTQALTKLKMLDLSFTNISDAGCAVLAAALNSGALPAPKYLELEDILASDAAKATAEAAWIEARANLEGAKSDLDDGSEPTDDEDEDESDAEDEDESMRMLVIRNEDDDDPMMWTDDEDQDEDEDEDGSDETFVSDVFL